VRPFDEDCESQVCPCGEEVAPGSGKCWKCSRATVPPAVKASSEMQTGSFCNLKFALSELGETSKSLRNEFVVAGASPSSSLSASPKSRSRVPVSPHEKALGAQGHVTDLIDEHNCARRLDYSDRPRAARPRNHYNLGDACEEHKPPSALGRPSPASLDTTQAPDGDSALGSPSPQRSRHSDSRPSTRRPSPGRTARSHGSLSTSEDIEIIDVTDSDSEESTEASLPSPSRAVLMRPPRAADSQQALDSRSLPNWASRRLFRRTLASYFVAQEGSPPPKSNSSGSLPHRLSNVHGPSPGINRSSGSGKNEVIEVTDL